MESERLPPSSPVPAVPSRSRLVRPAESVFNGEKEKVSRILSENKPAFISIEPPKKNKESGPSTATMKATFLPKIRTILRQRLFLILLPGGILRTLNFIERECRNFYLSGKVFFRA